MSQRDEYKVMESECDVPVDDVCVSVLYVCSMYVCFDCLFCSFPLRKTNLLHIRSMRHIKRIRMHTYINMLPMLKNNLICRKSIVDHQSFTKDLIITKKTLMIKVFVFPCECFLGSYCSQVCVYIDTCMHACINIYIHTYVCMYVCPKVYYIYIYIYIYLCLFLLFMPLFGQQTITFIAESKTQNTISFS